MTNRKKINPLTPIAVFVAAWLVKRTAKSTRKVISNKRGPETSPRKTEELFWKVGLALALAGTEALIKNLMQREATDQSEKLDPVD